MIKIENIETMGWEPAIRGMRNPMNSWDKSDSVKTFFQTDPINFLIGPNDLNLMMRLAKGGSTHAKYKRMIVVYLDVTAPLYWWKEYDTYKVGTVTNSCSTMHKIHAKEFTLDDFSWDQLLNTDCDLFELEWGRDCKTMMQPQHFLIQYIIPVLNICRKKYLKTKDKEYWWQMIQLLPSSYNQRRTLMLNYEVLSHIYHDRKDHKLDEWRKFCEMIKTLPYSQLITLEE